MSKSSLSHLKAVVQQQLSHYFSGAPSPRFIIAVSGGADSVCLLHLFTQLDIDGVVAHVNYQKRGTASDQDAQLVRKLADQWGFSYELLEADPKDAQGQNFQQWARDVRYRFFRDLVSKHGADGIALAHHRDDQVETILQKMFRGAGLSSWSGMPAWDGELFRPLLEISRQQIEQYVDENDIPFRTDESNLESDFARNFLRNEWTQKLDDFFPGWQANLLRIGQEAQNYEQALAWIARKIVNQRGIDKKAFDHLEAGLQRALVLHLLKKREQGLQISQQNLHRVSELSKLQTGKKIELTPQFSVIRDRNYYVIEKQGGGAIHPKKIDRHRLEESEIEFAHISFAIEPFKDQDLSQALYVDADVLTWPITVRRWKAGDRLQPLGMSGHQTVAEHLTNRKVSAARKKNVLVIETFEETICALIFPPIKNHSSSGTISEQVKCDSKTKYCLRIKYLA
ncbi:MAG: tRNA lysidine(34) synthetase TilS [Bacteroidota bacterium]